MGLSLSANHARGSQTGTAASHVDADLRAVERLSVLTGNDALVAGAQLRGREILLDIGGDLHVASRADTAQLRGSSVEAGIGLTIGLMPGAGTGLNLSLGGGRERADSSLVNQQTAIIADERLDARIEGHTQLDGGLIASLNGDLTLDTGTFGFSDITERARSDTRRATLNLGFGDGGSPSIGIEGELAHAATDAITRATIGEGEITIRDEDAQRAREEAGETREVAALNRDLDAARETLRDERAGVRFYASDSSVRAAIEAVDFIGRTLSEISQEAFRNMNSESFDQLADALESGAITDADVIAQLDACGTRRHGFNLFHLLISPAHASTECRIETNDGRIFTFSAREKEQCLEIYLSIAERSPEKIEAMIGSTPLVGSVAGLFGNLAAIFMDGPVLLVDEDTSEHYTFIDESGRYLYRNPLTGEYFYSNPNDRGDTVVVGSTTQLALGLGIGTRVTVGPRATAAPRAPWTSISSDARRIIRDIERHSGVRMTRDQRQQLFDQVRRRDHRNPATDAEYQQLNSAFRNSRTRIRDEWTQNTGQQWPRDARGHPYEMHHVIPKRYGGPNTWWNIHPAPRPTHQGGIHGRGSPTQSVFPTPIPR